MLKQRIEALRPRLLDTTRRNPLVNNAFPANSASYIPIVDEKPQSLINSLAAEKPLWIAPLPHLDEDELPDEKTKSFSTAYESAQQIDEEYVTAVKALDYDLDDLALEKQMQHERSLKDRVRQRLKLPPRPRGGQRQDLLHHAMIHGINPSKTLPSPSFESGDNRHEDDELQTLLLSEQLQSKLSRLFTKQRTFEEERGLSVTYLVIGYLQWGLADATLEQDAFKSPLVIVPVTLKRQRSSEGERYSIEQIEQAQINPVLRQKLEVESRLDLSELLSYVEHGITDIERLFEFVESIKPRAARIWKVKREATLGVYPFQGIDLYHDLRTEDVDFSKFKVLNDLMLGKSEKSEDAIDWSEVEVEGAEADEIIPHLVLDADSSQFLALMKVACGEDVALEGPPGSGKSQTIVNAIACALCEGKRVLFVAQKMTALEVVHSRLHSLNLSNFVLPLVGSKGDANTFYDALEERLEVGKKHAPKKIEALKQELKKERSKLNKYIELISGTVGATQISVYELMGLTVQHFDSLSTLPVTLSSVEVDFAKYRHNFDLNDFQALEIDIVRSARDLWNAKLEPSSPWFDTNFRSISYEAINEVKARGRAACQLVEHLLDQVSVSYRHDLEKLLQLHSLEQICSTVSLGEKWTEQNDPNWRMLVRGAGSVESPLRVLHGSHQELANLCIDSTLSLDGLRECFSLAESLEALTDYMTMSGLTNIVEGALEDSLERDRQNQLIVQNVNRCFGSSDLKSVYTHESLHNIQAAIDLDEYWRSSADKNWPKLLANRDGCLAQLDDIALLYNDQKKIVGSVNGDPALLRELGSNAASVSDLLQFLRLCDIHDLQVNPIRVLLKKKQRKHAEFSSARDQIDLLEASDFKLTPLQFCESFAAVQPIVNDKWMRDMLSRSSPTDALEQIAAGERALVNIYGIIEARCSVPDARILNRVTQTLKTTGFFGRFSSTYKKALRTAKNWLGYNAAEKVSVSEICSDLDFVSQEFNALAQLSIFDLIEEFTSDTRSFIKQSASKLQLALDRLGFIGLEEDALIRVLTDARVESVARILGENGFASSDWEGFRSELSQLNQCVTYASENLDRILEAAELCSNRGLWQTSRIRVMVEAGASLLETDDGIRRAADLIDMSPISLSESMVEKYREAMRRVEGLSDGVVRLLLKAARFENEVNTDLRSFHNAFTEFAAEQAGVLDSAARQGRANFDVPHAQISGSNASGFDEMAWLQFLESVDQMGRRLEFFESFASKIRDAEAFCLVNGLNLLESIRKSVRCAKDFVELESRMHAMGRELGLTPQLPGPEALYSYIELVREVNSLSRELVTYGLADAASERGRALGCLLKHLHDVSDLCAQLAIGKGLPHRMQTVAVELASVSSHLDDQAGFNSLIHRKDIIDSATKGGFESILIAMEAELPFSKADSLVPACLVMNLRKIADEQYGARLLRYSGKTLDEARRKISEIDRRLIQLAPRAVAAEALRLAAPPEGVGHGKKSEYTEMALLRHELGKQRRIAPRKLLKRASSALSELFPCWMMVPGSVAQHLPREEVFDLVIIDEASQMTPETAISALMRAPQALVSGDTNQLPPSNFFRGLSSDEDVDEDVVTDEESILELANTQFRPKHRLQWHYRSRHEELISFSNRYVYENDLVIFPSPTPHRDSMGVSLVKVQGTFQGGINPIEAEVMLGHIVQFMKEDQSRSLGVVVMNQAQMEQIDGMVLREAESDPDVARYVDRWAEEDEGLQRFFVKNLENVQGDERDVIYIGTVYGRDAIGKFHHRFGPINSRSGKRRLNVLFTRAKEQIVTFTSIPLEDFKPSEANEGANLLKLWLQHSASNSSRSNINEYHSKRSSPFEAYVINAIEALGYEVVPRLGVANYYIDIGVKHPDYPVGYLCGIECDGDGYQTAQNSRDRDRLRQEVLERLGWDLFRIWSTDWFRDPVGQALELQERLATLLAEKSAAIPEEVAQAMLIASAADVATTDPQTHFSDTRSKTDFRFSASDDESRKGAAQVVVGSFVRATYIDGPSEGETRGYNLVNSKTLRINEHPEGVYSSIEASTSLGIALVGAKLGDVVVWDDGGVRVSARIVSISRIPIAEYGDNVPEIAGQALDTHSTRDLSAKISTIQLKGFTKKH